MDEITRIVIENWPAPAAAPWPITWLPISVAVIALVVSLVSLYFSRKEHINSIRPFVWASEFGHLNEQQQIVPERKTIMLKVLNAPARIKVARYTFEKVSMNSKVQVFEHEVTNFCRYPDPGIQWVFTFNGLQDELDSLDEKTHIERNVCLNYQPLSGNQEYFYRGRAKYIQKENRWEMIEENAN